MFCVEGRTGLLFVCLGNICRSPMAEAVMLHKLKESGRDREFFVESAGLGHWHVGEMPDPRTIATLEAHGIEPASPARLVEAEDFKRFKYIFAMDDSNLFALKLMPGSIPSRVTLLRTWGNTFGKEIPDPFSGELADFERTYELVDDACSALIEKLPVQELA